MLSQCHYNVTSFMHKTAPCCNLRQGAVFHSLTTYLLEAGEEIGFGLRIEKFSFFVEVNCNRSYRKKLIIIFHRKSPPTREEQKLRGCHSCLLFCYFCGYCTAKKCNAANAKKEFSRPSGQ